MRVVVAMSGGVDSSVAAALLAEQGHEVLGLSMQLYDQREGTTGFGSCCTIDDLHDARRAAAAIGIPHYIVNFERQFDEHVVAGFVDEYMAGRTPIPCTRCNSEVKFRTLLERAVALGADAVATGHYATIERIEDNGATRWRLRRGVDRERDQAYFLFSLTQSQLARTLFPLGAMQKSEVRTIARQRRLPVAEKPESREICFVPDGDYASFVARRAATPPEPGLVVDARGHVLGRHEGIHRFTVGQRKGLGLSSPTPLYVIRLQPENGRVVVGPRTALERTTLTASEANWVSGNAPGGPLDVTVQIRYRHKPARAVVTPVDETRAAVVLAEPQAAVTPGQAVVFFGGEEGDIVVGGGWIA
jgi:tRNA-uridine 2-sulfurtransferase